MALANELTKGMVIILNGELHSVVEATFYKPTKGGGLMRTKLKNIRKNNQFDKTFSTSEKIEIADVTWRKMQLLYVEGDNYVFMDNENYEQYNVSKDIIADASKWLLPEMNIDIAIYNDEAVMINMPFHVELKVTIAPPGIKGDTVSGATKRITVETGAEINAPLFIKENDIIKVDTRDGSYVERVKQ